MAKIKQAPPSKGKASDRTVSGQLPDSSGQPADKDRTTATAESPEKPQENKGSGESERTQNGQSADTEPTLKERDEFFATHSVTITAPVAVEVVGHTRRGVSIKGMSTKQREGLQRLRNGLIRDKAELANGSPVMNDGAAVRWLLEQVGGFGFGNSEPEMGNALPISGVNR